MTLVLIVYIIFFLIPLLLISYLTIKGLRELYRGYKINKKRKAFKIIKGDKSDYSFKIKQKL